MEENIQILYDVNNKEIMNHRPFELKNKRRSYEFNLRNKESLQRAELQDIEN